MSPKSQHLDFRVSRRFNRWDAVRDVVSASIAILWLTLSALAVGAQQRPGSAPAERGAEPSTAPAPVNARMLENTNRDYRISVGDQIRIEVTDAPEMSREYQVFASGEI